MNLGPIDHCEPGLPAAQNLENFYQFAKIFEGETPVMEQLIRNNGYLSEPQRHKIPRFES